MATPTDSRTVRVFLSSTFRDFAEERDLLVRKVFPELRRKCRERQVELVDVDLRWGITEKEAQQGKVLPICLAEVDRSRPWFMGFIGERYGWVPAPEQYDPAIVQEQPWLEEHRGGKSVTELEILHGVLNNPEMKNRAFFYFRDSKWSKKKGGSYLSEGSEEKAKLEGLKERIRQSGFPVQENYPSPEALAERVKEDLWKLIDEAYPESEVPDALTRERMAHEAYAATRCRLYLGGERYFVALDDAMKAKSFRPVLITGQSGGGKSALLANWVKRWSPKHSKTAVIVHHLGCGSDAADPVRLAVRLMLEISRLTGDEFKLESDPEKLLEQLPQWLALASAWAQRSKKELLIVLDGLDKVSDRKHLRWFPGFLPPKVKLVASCLHGEILEAAKGRLDLQELKVKPFIKAEQRNFIGEYLGRYRKALTPKQMKTLQGHPLSGNPLFLLTVLEELRVFGVHEQLEQRMRTLLSPPPSKEQGEAPTVDDVFEHVLARIEKDLGKKGVQQAMEAIWASRAGLHQDELLAIAKLSPARLAAIQNALDESMYESSGRITFGHDYLRKAVEDRYELTSKRKLKLHRRLAEWFYKQPDFFDVKYAQPNVRRTYELPYQLILSKSAEKLETVLTSARFLLSACSEGRTLELIHTFDRASDILKGGEFNEWREFIQTNAYLIDGNTSNVPSLIAFLQLGIESGTLHPMRPACLQLLRAEMPSDPILFSLSAFDRRTYKEAFRIKNIFQVDGGGPLLTDVIIIDSKYFASFGVNYQIWHISEGLKFEMEKESGVGTYCYSTQRLRKLLKAAKIANLSDKTINFDKIEVELKSREKDCIKLDANYSVFWSDPELGERYLEVQDHDGTSVTKLYGHADVLAGAVIVDCAHFLSWGWDDKIVLWEYDTRMLEETASKAPIVHSEEPNRCLVDNNRNHLFVWTYKPHLDDYGYKEDRCVSIWDFRTGSLCRTFAVIPYITNVEVRHNAIKIDGTSFWISNEYRDEEYLTWSESQKPPSSADELKMFVGYAYPMTLRTLTEANGVSALVSRSGAVLFVRQLTTKDLVQSCSS